jgi:hypothetical protein
MRFHTLQEELNSLDITTRHDKWDFAWGDRYSVKKVYNLIGDTHHAPQPILDIWKTSNIPRQNFFAWLTLHGRLNTKDMMSKIFFMWSSMTAFYARSVPKKPSCTCSLNAASAKASDGRLVLNGTLICTSMI